MQSREPDAHKLVTMPTAHDGRCPHCGEGASLRRYLFGMTTGDPVDTSTIHLGGCTVFDEPAPAFRCVACDSDFDSGGTRIPYDGAMPLTLRLARSSATRRPEPEHSEGTETHSRDRSDGRHPVVEQRLTTECEDVESLLELLDLDDLEDLGTFFQFLLGRPVAVELIDSEVDPNRFFIMVRCRTDWLGAQFPWPVTLENLMRSCFDADHVRAGHFAGARQLPYDPPDLATMPIRDLQRILDDTLGRTRIFKTVWDD